MDDFITARRKDDAVVSVCQDNKKKKRVNFRAQSSRKEFVKIRGREFT